MSRLNSSFLKLVLSTSAAILIGSAQAGLAFSQTPQPPRVAVLDGPVLEMSPAIRRDFQKAFSAISSGAHLTVVAEGIPLHPVLTDAQASALNDELVKVAKSSLREELTAEAAAFDYDVESKSANVVLLRKRYSDPMDIPNVTWKEIVYSLREIVDLTGGVQSDGEDPPQLRLYQALTPEQRESALRGLPVSQLDSGQETVAREIPIQIILHDRTALTWRTQDKLTRVEDKRVWFGWKTLEFAGKTAQGQTAEELAAEGVRPFGYYGPIGRNGIDGQAPLSDGFESFTGGYKILGPERAKEIGAGSAIPTPEDARLAGGMMSNALPSTLTLEDAARVNLAAKSAHASTTSGSASSADDVVVEEAVATKPACVFGAQYCEREDYLRALAGIYGLRFQKLESGHYRIGIQLQHAVDKISDIPMEILRLLPASLYHSYLRQKALFMAAGPAAVDRSVLDPPRPSGTMSPARKDFLAGETASRAYYYPAVRRLLSFAMKAADASPTKTVPVKSLDPEARRLIAIAMFSSGQVDHELFQLLEFKSPEFLLHPEALCLKFQIVPGKTPTLLTSLGLKDESGEFHPQAVGGVPMPAPAQ